MCRSTPLRSGCLFNIFPQLGSNENHPLSSSGAIVLIRNLQRGSLLQTLQRVSWLKEWAKQFNQWLSSHPLIVREPSPRARSLCSISLSQQTHPPHKSTGDSLPSEQVARVRAVCQDSFHLLPGSEKLIGPFLQSICSSRSARASLMSQLMRAWGALSHPPAKRSQRPIAPAHTSTCCMGLKAALFRSALYICSEFWAHFCLTKCVPFF